MAELYKFQKDAVSELLNGKRIIYATMGCLAEGTPIVMSDGTVAPVQKLKIGDSVLSYNEDTNRWVDNTVADVIRTSHKPKPMIELEYDGEKITTTYDHPFFNGEGYYPLYQLIWGALEASQRAQLKLLCKQYGQAFDDKAIWCKHCSSNEAVEGRMWLLQNNVGWEDCQGPQSSGRELAEQPYQIAMCEPYQRRQDGQQSRKPRVVLRQVQCMVGGEDWEDKSPAISKESIDRGTTSLHKAVLSGQYGKTIKDGEKETLRKAAKTISKCRESKNKSVGGWVCKVLEARPYYTISLCKAPYTYCIGQRHRYLVHNSGKTAITLKWAEQELERTNKDKLLVITTASKSHTTDWQDESKLFTTMSPREFEVVSWHMAKKWCSKKTYDEMSDWVVIFDELQRAKQGVSSLMGKAFLTLTKHCASWVGATGTPGDKWIDFYPYFQACGKVRNKTQFKREFCIEQRYPFPCILSYTHEPQLRDWWGEISYAPDTSDVMAQLPKERHKVISLPTPKGYKKVLKTSTTLDGEFLDSNMALLHELRQMCATPDKLSALSDILESLSSPLVLFYNYTCEREQILGLAQKLGRKVWRIDGERHEIPTAETIGERDIVLCHYLSGSEALNLQFCNYWLSYSYNYSYSTSKQARGRIKRIGQTKPMFFYYMETEGTIEQEVKQALHNKSDFAQETWSPERS